ncbi:LOW QUALITY PROTEIN: aldo-keto reductase family 1 member A1-B-like [Menidia menidia]
MGEAAVLNTGSKMPLLGLGTWKSPPGKVKQAVLWALEAGYRHIDCAAVYGNEAEIGEALEEALGPHGALRREDLFLTSKLWNTQHRPADVEPALQKTLRDLKIKHLDLYLMHWPHAFRPGDDPFPRGEDGALLYDLTPPLETWASMEGLVGGGQVRSIGLSNFNHRQVQEVLDHARVPPSVLQVESHPFLAQPELLGLCGERGLVLTAYSPLGSPDRAWRPPQEPVLLQDPLVQALGLKHHRTPAQVLLRWQVQRGVVTIPKSVTESRIRENIQIFDFQLEEEDMSSLSRLNRGWRYIVPMVEVGGRLVPRDAGHPFYPFNDPY